MLDVTTANASVCGYGASKSSFTVAQRLPAELWITAPLIDLMELSKLTFDADSPTEPRWQRTRIRVPREDSTFLAIPAIHDASRLVRENGDRFTRFGMVRIAGQSLAEFQASARTESLAAARKWTAILLGRPDSDDRANGDRANDDRANDDRANDDRANSAEPRDSANAGVTPVAPIIATGHQPDFFHPGVWVKHLATAELCRQTGATGLNLIVDNDALGSTLLRVPSGSRDKPTLEPVFFDRPRSGAPWEEVRVEDSELFVTFSQRVQARMRESQLAGVPELKSPFIADLWPRVVEHCRQDDRLAMCLSAARVQVEHEWGLGNLELPLSELCATRSFLAFAVHVLCRADWFRDVYNSVLSEFRNVNRIRSQTHPVPELQRIGDWIEAPFRVWRHGDQKRARVFVRHRITTASRPQIDLSSSPAECDVFASFRGVENLSANTDTGQIDEAIDALQRLPESGVRFRTRALTTTLFARLCLCDLFVHGIGGAKYDEMTDRILVRFFGVEPPSFLTLSASVFLPGLNPFSEVPADARRLRQTLRELKHNPQRHLRGSHSAEVIALLEEKSRLIEAQQASDERTRQQLRHSRSDRSGPARYRRLSAINRQLASFLQSRADQIREELDVVEARLAANAILRSREYSIVLFPPARLRRMVDELRGQLGNSQ